MRQRITDLNARSWWIPAVLLKICLGLVLSGIILALLVPALHAKGWGFPGWVAWGVILGSLAFCVGPDVWNRYRRPR
ncbi:MAG: hypothetical protein ABIP65_09040 [Vicinamibacterales bacterium]